MNTYMASIFRASHSSNTRSCFARRARLLQTQVVLVERGAVRGDDAHQADYLGHLVAGHVLREEGRRNLAGLQAAQGVVVVEFSEVAEILLEERGLREAFTSPA